MQLAQPVLSQSGVRRRHEQVHTLEQVLRRLPNARLAEGKNDFLHVPMFTMRALRELQLEFDRCSSTRRG